MKAENNKQEEQPNENINSKKNKEYVFSARDWKDYLGESFLIIFSVLLALTATEYINRLNEKEKTKNLLKSIISELKYNKKAIQEMQAYNLQVLNKIDSVLANKSLQDKIVSNDEFHLEIIAPHGVLFRYLDKEAWVIAKNNNIMSKIDISSISILSKVYDDQDRISKVEDEVARVIFDRVSRDSKHIHTTLILIRDIYHGWAVDRTPTLLSKIDNAIKQIDKIYQKN